MIVINNKSYVGTQLTIDGIKIIIDGREVTEDHQQKEINIKVEGGLEKLDVSSCRSLVVNGDVGSVKTVSGDIDCRDIKGDVRTVSGDVNAHDVGGSVNTISGDIRHARR